jgi:hypothetical protein
LRLVAAVDVAWAEDAEDDDDPSAVTLEEPVPFRLLAAVLADSDDARDTVAAAQRDADPASTLDHDLGWYAAQEVPALLDRLTGGVPRSAHGRRHPTTGPGQRAEPDLRPGDPGA